MEEFEYYIDGKRASEDDVNGELDYQAKWYAMDTGIYDDYMQGQIAESDYEAFINDHVEKLKKELNENGVLMGELRIEKVKVYKY